MDAFQQAPLNIHPQGLLDFFGVKTGGRYPQRLADTLQPTIDLRDWYLESNALEYALIGPTWTTPQSGPVLVGWSSTSPVGQLTVVPNGEWWYVMQYSIQYQFDLLGTGEALTPLPCYRAAGGSTSAYSVMPYCNDVAVIALSTTYQRVIANAISRPVLVPPGATIGFVQMGATAAGGSGIATIGHLRYARARLR